MEPPVICYASFFFPVPNCKQGICKADKERYLTAWNNL